jgi:hypothetical protein
MNFHTHNYWKLICLSQHGVLGFVNIYDKFWESFQGKFV